MTRNQKRIKRELSELKAVKELNLDKQNQVVGGTGNNNKQNTLIINDGKQDQKKSSFKK